MEQERTAKKNYIATFIVERKRVKGWSQQYDVFRFRCPICGKTNTHTAEGGYRVSHCACWPRGYYIREAKVRAKLNAD